MKANLTLRERAGRVSTTTGEQVVLCVQYAVAGLFRRQQVNDRSGLSQHAVPGGGQLHGIRRHALEFELRHFDRRIVGGAPRMREQRAGAVPRVFAAAAHSRYPSGCNRRSALIASTQSRTSSRPTIARTLLVARSKGCMVNPSWPCSMRGKKRNALSRAHSMRTASPDLPITAATKPGTSRSGETV